MPSPRAATERRGGATGDYRPLTNVQASEEDGPSTRATADQDDEEVEVTLYGDGRGLGIGPSLQEQHVSPVVGPPRDNMLIRSLNGPEPAFHRLTASSPEPGDDQSRRPPLWLQLTYFIAVVCFLLFFLIDSLTSQRLFKQLERLFQWVEDHPWRGPLAFFGVVILFAIICVPESVLTIGGGYIFGRTHGVVLGMLLCVTVTFCGAMCGSLIAFLISRHLLQRNARTWAQHFTILRAIDRSFEENGAKMVFLLRLSPVVPFYILSYILGASSVAIKDFAVGNVGMLPWVITCSYIGNALKGIQDVSLRHIPTSNRVITITCYVVGAVATVGVLYILSVYTKRAFDEVLQSERNSAVANGGGSIQDSSPPQGDASIGRSGMVEVSAVGAPPS